MDSIWTDGTGKTTQKDGSQSPKPWDTTQSFDDDLILILSRKKRTSEKPKYLFLTEKDATVKGEFSEKFKDDREHKDIPRPYQGERPNMGPKAYSSMGMGMISATPDRKSGKLSQTDSKSYNIFMFNETNGRMEEYRTPKREVLGSVPALAMKCLSKTP